MFSAGDTVICVDSSINPEHMDKVCRMFPIWIVKDRKYTIRQINGNDDIVPGLLLEEVPNPRIYIPLLKKMQEPMFKLSRFKKASPDIVREEENVEENELVELL